MLILLTLNVIQDVKLLNDELRQVSGGFEVTSREAFHSREQGKVLSGSYFDKWP